MTVRICTQGIVHYLVFGQQVSSATIFRGHRLAWRYLRIANIGRFTSRKCVIFVPLHAERKLITFFLGLIAICWASMMYYGKSGYIEATKKVVETHRFITKGWVAIFS